MAPLAGAAIAGIGYRFIVGDSGSEPVAEEAQASAASGRVDRRDGRYPTSEGEEISMTKSAGRA